MDVNNLKPNTDSYRESERKQQQSSETEEKKITKVVDGKVVTKKNGLRKITGALFADDLSNIGDNLVNEVFIPSIRKFAADSLDRCIDVIFYGDRGRSKDRSPATRYNYARPYDDRKRDESKRTTTVTRRYDYRDICTPTRREAENVIIGMEDLIKRYGIVSVGDLYELCDVQADYTDYKYGWSNVSGAEVVPVRDGYLIKLPKALPLD